MNRNYFGRIAGISSRKLWRNSAAGAILLAACLVAGFTISSAAQDTALARAASVVQPQAYVSLAPIPRGHAFEIAVVAKITPGFHVNAHEPSEEYLIPTKITADLPAGVTVVETDYPRGIMRSFNFSKTPLRVYEASFTVRLKLRTGNSAPIGHQKIALTVGYQACNQDSCLPPTKIPASLDLDIADADAPARPVHADIFSSAAAAKPAAH
jgi:thiol:disulfide interchange protein DsbD